MNVLDLLREHRVDVREAGSHHHVTPGWAGVDCPYCSPKSGRYRLGINLASGKVSCWACGGHSLSRTLELLTGETQREVLRIVSGLKYDASNVGPRARGKLTPPVGVMPLLDPHRRYLRWRGFDPKEIANQWKVQGIGIAPKLSWHLYIPIHFEGEVVSWTCRSLSRDPEAKRYHNARPDQESVSAKSLLYGWDFVRDSVIVVEGPTDAWALGPGAVAVMGLKVSEEQIAMLTQVPRRIVCFDGEPQAQRRAVKLCDRLEIYPGTTANAVPSRKDAASLNPRQRKKLREAILS